MSILYIFDYQFNQNYMKSMIILLSVVFLATGCKKSEPVSKCRPYLEAVKDGTIPRKTTTVNLTDSLSYELDYVRDQEYRDYPRFCYGHLELNANDFRTALAAVTRKYSADSTHRFYMFAEGADICNKDTLKAKQIKYLLINYIAKDKTTWFDFVNLTTGITTRHPDSGAASVYIYLLMKKTGITHLPSNTTFKNKDFDFSNVRLLDRKDDPLYPEANP